MPLSATMAPIPDELRMAAEASDDEVGEGFMVLIPTPERPYSAKVATALAKAIAEVARVMGLELQPDPYDGPVPELDPDVARFLAMVSAAADDYGKPLPIALEAIKGDKELTVLTAALMQLAKDKEFKNFMNMPIEEEEVTAEATPEGMDEEVEFDFASRMR